MFWRMTGLAPTSPVESILDKEDYTLDELLDEDEIIQECKALNSRLINFSRATLVKAMEYQNDFTQCLERLISDPAERLTIMDEMSLYREGKGFFSKSLAISALQTLDPLILASKLRRYCCWQGGFWDFVAQHLVVRGIGLHLTSLRESTQVEQLLQYIVEEAPEGSEKRSLKFPYIACEIFTCEVDVILRTLVENDELMSLLFSFLNPDRQHSMMLAGYFSKVVICLMSRKTLAHMSFIQEHKEIVHQLVDLIGITSIMEVLTRLIGADDHYNFLDTPTWLEDMNVLEMIVDKLSSSDSPEVHANVAEILCAITRYAPPRLSAQISSPSFVGRLFHHALDDSRPKSVLVHSLTICISLLDPKRFTSSPYNPYRSQLTQVLPLTVNPVTIDGMLESLSNLFKLLDTSSPESILPTTYGTLQPPLGKHRLKIVEFISVLLTIGHDSAEKELIRLRVLSRVLDIFFEYPFNNFLHHHVENIIISCLESNQSLLAEYLLHKYGLIDRILGAEKKFILPFDITKATVPAVGKSSPRIGNIGHITRLANKLDQLSSSNSIIQAHLQENVEWIDWHSNVLCKRNALENIYQWGCGHPAGLHDRRDNDDEDYKIRDHDIPPQDILEVDDIHLTGMNLNDDQVSNSLIANCHWFSVEANQFDNATYPSPSHIIDETDEVDENNELLDTAMSCPFSQSEEPESVFSLNDPFDFEDSEYPSTNREHENSSEWVEWRETSGKIDMANPFQTLVIPNGDVKGDREHKVVEKMDDVQ